MSNDCIRVRGKAMTFYFHVECFAEPEADVDAMIVDSIGIMAQCQDCGEWIGNPSREPGR